MKNRITIFVILAVLGVRSSAAEWKTHTNARFGFQIDLPATLKPGPMPDNGAGRTFSDGNLTMIVQGHFTHGSKLENFRKQALSTYGKSITYQVSKKDWFVVSGVLPDGTEFYHKLHVKGGNWASFTATYPHAMNKTFDPVITKMVGSFKPFLPGSYDRIP